MRLPALSGGKAAQGLARRLSVDAPVTDAVCAIIDGAMTPHGAVTALMGRPLRNE